MIVLGTYTFLFILITQAYPLLIRISFPGKKFTDSSGQRFLVLNAPFINAWLTGLYKPSIMVTARLVDILSDAELRAIIIHERGHFYRKHIWKSLGINILRLWLIIGLLGIVFNVWWTALLTLPFFFVSRRLYDETPKHEFEADEVVINEGLAIHMISALRKLSNSELTQKRIKRLQDAI